MRRLRDWLSCFVPAVPWLITAVLIVAVLLILVSALSPKAHAQFGGVQQPMFGILSSAASESITNHAARSYYWNFQDLTNGTVVAWPDRIQGLTFQRYNPAAGPVKNTNGVWFTNVTGKTTVLTNEGTAFTTNVVMGLIWTPIVPSGTYGNFMTVTNPLPTYKFFTLNKWSGSLCYVDWGAPPHITFAFPYPASGQRCIVWSWNGPQLMVWTNNVQSYSNNPASTYHGLAVNMLQSTTGTDANQFRGAIQELIMWTNVTDPDYIRTNYYNYATNTYGFTPP